MRDRIKRWIDRYLEQELAEHLNEKERLRQQLLALEKKTKELEQVFNESQQNQLSLDLWQEVANEESAMMIFLPQVVIHSPLCSNEMCVKVEYRNGLCLLHYEEALAKGQFIA